MSSQEKGPSCAKGVMKESAIAIHLLGLQIMSWCSEVRMILVFHVAVRELVYLSCSNIFIWLFSNVFQVYNVVD